MKLKGKTALITGGSSGIGLATARLFQAEGARVAITGRDPEALERARAELGGDAIAIVADVRSRAELERARQQLADVAGTLPVLFANAGVAFGTLLDATEEARFDELININVKGVFQTVQAFVPLMEPGGSVILNTSWLADVGTPGLSALSASKAAVRSFARTFAAELLPRGIRVNAVSPGATDTPIHGKAGRSAEQTQAFAERVQSHIPLKRFGAAIDVARAALFLASDDSTYMLGAEIAVDGGFAQI